LPFCTDLNNIKVLVQGFDPTAFDKIHSFLNLSLL